MTVGADRATPGREEGSSRLPEALLLHLRRLASTPTLLVGCDYDGTLAPIVDDPTQAHPIREAIVALRSLASLPSTSVVVVSGRSLRDLATLSRLPSEVHLIGSHGSEFDLGFVDQLDPLARDLLRDLQGDVHAIIADAPGAFIESKPASLSVHVRRCSPEDARVVIARVLEGPARRPGVQITQGKQIVELSVVETNKGHAFTTVRGRLGITAAIFIGDDITDETVFATLSGPDVGVKVGEGTTQAMERIRGPEDVAIVLATLLEERRTWLAGADATPIEDHALLSDGRIPALVTPRGRITWLCHPDVDSAAVFAEILGGPDAGHLSVEPIHGGTPLAQNYVADTMTIRTRWAGLTVVDYLDRSHHHDEHVSRQTRLVRVIEGRVATRISFAPRPEFGSTPIRLSVTPDGVRVTGGSEPIVLRCPEATWSIHTSGHHETAVGVLDESALSHGPVVLELRLGTDDITPAAMAEADRRWATHEYWQRWADALTLPATSRDFTRRSALTLKALCHEPTGAILAAATTSLPEGLGGVRNWDYRYCWIRDGAMTAHTLLLLGSTEEADEFVAWLHRVLAASSAPEHLHPLYTVHGTPLGAEAVVDTLPGYSGSRPVRVGNAAQGQVQLDVFGPVMDLLDDLTARRGHVSDADAALARACMSAVERRWQEPDHGIWEIRDRPRHHVHSRVMCWVTVDRGVRILDRHGVDSAERAHWDALRTTIADEILEHGWSESQQSFVAAYDRHDLDASALYVVLTGLLAADDPRLLHTVQAIEAGLRVGPTVVRYRYDDGIPGAEGGMNICTSWLIECYVRAGLMEPAAELYAQMIAGAGPTGLLPEQRDLQSGRGLGNHPQAYSHLGAIRCALALDAAGVPPLPVLR